jgi:mono/diheme cytochrome c family protein
MRKRSIIRTLGGLFFAATVWLASTSMVHAQFTQNRDKIKIDTSAYPADIRKDYRMFRTKCNECHGLDTSLTPSFSSDQWTAEVKRMQGMASSQFNDQQATAILNFLNYDESHRKAQEKSAEASSAPGGDPVAAGRQFYLAQSCDACHTLKGAGNAVGPTMDGVGSRLTRAKLLRRMQDRRAGSVMPTLPTDTTDKQLNDLVDFLMTLKKH